MTEYRYVVDDQVLRAFANLSARDRAEWYGGFELLAEHPHQPPDSIYNAASGRPMFVKKFPRWRITYWVDDGACEIRITDVKRASLVT
jgi:hypothetical protein